MQCFLDPPSEPVSIMVNTRCLIPQDLVGERRDPAVTACGYPFAWNTLERWFSSSLRSFLMHTRSAFDLRQDTTLVLTCGWWWDRK